MVIDPNPGEEWTCPKLVRLFDEALGKLGQVTVSSAALLLGIEMTLQEARQRCKVQIARGWMSSLGLPINAAYQLAIGIIEESSS